MNLLVYSYAGGDPINHCDVTGRCVQDMQKLQPQNVESEPLDPVQTTTATNQGLIGQISSGLGNLLGNIPLVGGILKGAVNIAGGVLDSAVGAVTLGQLYNPSGGITQAFGGVGNVLGGALDLAGKAWNSPNTALGVIGGLAGVPFGASIHFGNNAIQFWDYPWGGGGALTLGNSQIYAWPVTPANGPNNIWWPRYDNTADIRLGFHEEQHTYQSQLLGPLFLPVYGLLGGISGSNPLEQNADDHSAAVAGSRPVTARPYVDPYQ